MGFKKESKSSATSTSPCSDLRSAYQNCFNRWYSEKFVKGQWDKEDCVSEWNKYRACLSEHLEDRNLRRFLEEEMHVNSSIKADGTSLDETPIELIENYLRMCQSGAIFS